MPVTLLKPHGIILKNRLFRSRRRVLNRDFLVVLISSLLIAAAYAATHRFLDRLQTHPIYDPLIPVRLLSFIMLTFFLLLLFSSIISALGHLFAAKDTPLLLTLPVSIRRLYLSRLLETVFTSSWMFAMFGIPAFLAFYSSLDLPPQALLTAIFVFIPFVLIPAALGMIVATVFVNLIPPHRIRDLMVILAFIIVFTVLLRGNDSEVHLSTEQERLNHFIRYLLLTEPVQPMWLPSRWAGEALASYLIPVPGSATLFLLLLNATALGLICLGFLVHDYLFLRGWGVATQGPNLRLQGPRLSERLSPLLFPFQPQLRAVCTKEIRMFVRDTTQSMQLLMLLMLTFVYLYNFRTLRVISDLSENTVYWWQVILAVANTAFGSCVVAAIATRFVFPSVSLEGSAFVLVRCTPMTIEQFLRNKFFTWLPPISAISLVLFVSGAWAIQAPPQAVLASAIIAVALSIGIVGLGIGVGAVYAKFDWDSPAQVTASFGSLVYMLLALGAILLTIIPTIFAFVLTCVPTLSERIGERDYFIALVCTYALVFLINWGATRRALSAGAQRLRELEA